MRNLSIIGDVLIDYTLSGDGDKMRLGGIAHACRGAWALNWGYVALYHAPSYLHEGFEEYIQHHDGSAIAIGTIYGCPNLILIKESKEVGDQGYELILRKRRKDHLEATTLEDCLKVPSEDTLVFTGGYDLAKVLYCIGRANTAVHIDISNDIDDVEILAALGRKFDTVFISTSSKLFIETFEKDFSALSLGLQPFAEQIVFKENRGGSRLVHFQTKETLLIPAQTRQIKHSVGVGDNYNVAFLWARRNFDLIDSLHFASWAAAAYAATTYPDDYKSEVSALIKGDLRVLKEFPGVDLRWEDRPRINIYIAAPDFDYLDTKVVRQVEEMLQYHNFSPRLPIQENGQLSENSSEAKKEETCRKDIELLEQCQIVLGVLLNNDPGTLMELGYASARSKVVLVYDPYSKAQNCILKYLPNLVSNDLDEIISAVFAYSSKIK